MRDKYAEITDKLDSLLNEVGGVVDSLSCVSYFLAEEATPTPQQSRLFQNAVWANTQYLERLHIDLQDINTKLWGMSGQIREKEAENT